MYLSASSAPPLSRTQLSLATIVRLSIDPVIAIGSLFCVALLLGETLEGQYLILALIVFSLTFPGKAPTATSFLGLIREIFVHWSAIVVLLVCIGYATRSLHSFPLDVLIYWGVTVPLGLVIGHRWIPAALPRFLPAEGRRRKAVIVGGSELGRKLARQLHLMPMKNVEFVGFFDDRNSKRLHELEGSLLGNASQVAAYVSSHRIDQIYVTLPMASQPRILKLLEELRDTTASIYFVPDIFLFDLIQARMDNINGIPIVAVCETPFYGINGLIKRLSDLLLASVILILSLPLMVLLAFGVRLSSPGPVLFKQRRYGLDGQEIVVYKFRSMAVCDDGDIVKQAQRGDSRTTKFGSFLRRTSLDELPQFFNVLQGRMSIVGPRPHAVAHNELYRKLISGYMVRHKVRPGITGWAQVNGFRGETETLDKMRKRIECDLDYLRGWSPRLDMVIILKTIWLIARDRNAF